MYVCLSSCRIAIFGKHHAHMCHITNLIVSSSISSAILRSKKRIFFRSLVAGGGRWGHFYVRFRAHIKHIYLDFQMFPQLVSISLSVCLSFSVYFWGTVAQHLELTAGVETMLKVNKKKHHTKPIHTHTESVSSSPSPPPPPHFALSSHIKTLHSIE